MKDRVDIAFEFVREKLFSSKTRLIYDHVLQNREHELPTVAEIEAVFPNPCGYSTGMEDGSINGGTMLDACVIRYENERDEAAASFARELVGGLLDCAFSADSEGFLPRGVSVSDGKSHYPDSSRDQYTMFAFGLHRYLRSALCTPAERERIARAAVAIARRAERNVIAENGYDMLTEDGRPTLCTVLWGDDLGNHEYFRLPMLYLFAYEASGEAHWLEKYREIRQRAYERSLPMGRYWAMYTLQQMQASIRLCYDVEDEEEWRTRYLYLMNCVADHANGSVDRVREKMLTHREHFNAPQVSFREIEATPAERFLRLGYANAVTLQRADHYAFFAIQDCAQLSIITGLVPDRARNEGVAALFAEAFEQIDFSIHERNLPLFFFAGYYRGVYGD